MREGAKEIQVFSKSKIFWRAGWLLWACAVLGWAQGTNYQNALAYVQQRQFDRAVPLLQEILKQAPGDIKARNLLGIALSAAGRRQEAADQFKKLLTLDPKFVPALKNLALNELALGRAEEARLHFEAALELAPRDPACHFGLAELAFAGRDFKNAAIHYELSGDLALPTQGSRDPRIALKFATSFLETGQGARAVAVLEKIQEDMDADSHFQAGVLLARLEKYGAAARRFELARDSSTAYPDRYQVGFNLTLVLSKNGNHAAAIQAGEQTLAGGFRKAEMYNLLAQAYEQGGQTKQAYDALRAAVEIEPREESNYLDLIALCLKHENYDLGLEIAEIGARRVAGSHRLHLHHGVTLVMKGRMAAAIEAFQAAERLLPAEATHESLPRIALGLALIQMDRQDEAIALLRRQSERSPKDARVFWLLGEALGRSGVAAGSAEEKEAVLALEKSIRLDPRLPQPHALLGKILLRRGDHDRAAIALEQAIALDPEDLNATYLLAQALQRKGQVERAKQLFARFAQAKTEKSNPAQRNLLRILKAGRQ